MDRSPSSLFVSLAFDAAAVGALRKLVFSNPRAKDGSRVSARLCLLRGETVLATEKQTADGKALHNNIPLSEAEAVIARLTEEYRQADLLTPLGDAEYRCGKKGNAVVLGERRLREKINAERGSFSEAVTDTLDRKKQYILQGDEPFLIALAISDKNGRIHDKKQAKFRQINRFLEHIRDIEQYLPAEGPLLIYDLCCGKSYLSFAVYHYFRVLRGREVEMLGMDLKADCMRFCADAAESLGFSGMTFRTGDVRVLPTDRAPHLVLSLHACDVATDIVLQLSASLSAGVILSTPCCQHDLLGRVRMPSLSFVTDYPKLSGKLCEVLTDALRLARLEAEGYETAALELTDPDDTPKNTLLRAVRRPHFDPSSARAVAARARYREALRLVLGEGYEDYPFERPQTTRRTDNG